MSAYSQNVAKWAVVVATGGLVAGLLAVYPSLSRVGRDMGVPVAAATVSAEVKPTPIDGGNALAFAKALQANDCDEVIRLTAWMSDRLRRVALESSDPVYVAKARKKLCEKILARPYEDNVLRKEGIDDQFVFAPGAQLEVVSKDDGRSDLGTAVAERVWIRVTYPRRETAPLAPVAAGSPDMKPVRQWTVGVNIAREGEQVLKAAVQGNLEIKRDSAVFDWPQ
ncbi:MAG: hypothetical protein HUU46_18895 [Candidatus Hydrogenedentes bacterium]|nr:hypothetical protein [Candidatus Hydrogenedentota bacterium]